MWDRAEKPIARAPLGSTHPSPGSAPALLGLSFLRTVPLLIHTAQAARRSKRVIVLAYLPIPR